MSHLEGVLAYEVSARVKPLFRPCLHVDELLCLLDCVSHSRLRLGTDHRNGTYVKSSVKTKVVRKQRP